MSVIISLSGYMGCGKDTAASALVKELGFTKVSFAGPLKDATGVLVGVSPALLDTQEFKSAALGLDHIWPFMDRDGLDDIIDQMVMTAYGYSMAQLRDPVLSRQRTEAYPYDPPALVQARVRLNFHRYVDPELFECTADQQVTLTPTPRKLLQLLGTEVFRFAYEDTWVEAWKRRASRLDRVVATDTRYSNEVRAVRSLGGTVWRVDSNREGVGKNVSHASEREFLTFRYDSVLNNNASVEDLHALSIASATSYLSHLKRSASVGIAD